MLYYMNGAIQKAFHGIWWWTWRWREHSHNTSK
jgi:hypothetical protein